MAQMDLLMSEVGARTAFWLRAAWSGSVVKQTANLLGISERQAKRLLSGVPPTSDQLGILARKFGWRFVNFVMEPAVGTPAMLAEMQAFDERLRRLEAERKADEALVLEAVGPGADRRGGGASMGREDAPAADRDAAA